MYMINLFDRNRDGSKYMGSICGTHGIVCFIYSNSNITTLYNTLALSMFSGPFFFLTINQDF